MLIIVVSFSVPNIGIRVQYPQGFRLFLLFSDFRVVLTFCYLVLQEVILLCKSVQYSCKSVLKIERMFNSRKYLIFRGLSW